MNRPIGAMIIAFLLFLRGLWGVITGFIGLGIGTLNFLTGLYNPGSVSIFWGVVALIVGLIMLWLAYGLFAMRPWAWMWSVIILAIGLIVDLIAGFSGGFNWISIILGAIVLIYLVSSGVRSAYTMQD